MASPVTINGVGSVNLQHTVVVEMPLAPPHPPPLLETSPLELESASSVVEELSYEIAPLLPQTDRWNHKMNIFVSHPRRKPRKTYMSSPLAANVGVTTVICFEENEDLESCKGTASDIKKLQHKALPNLVIFRPEMNSYRDQGCHSSFQEDKNSQRKCYFQH